MVNVTMKCPKCGKTWTEKIDEHDIERYFPGKQFMKSICDCDNLRNNFKDFVHPQACYTCLDM